MHTSEHSKQVCFFAKTSTRVHYILSSMNYHEVTQFSHKNLKEIQYFHPNHGSICLLLCVYVLVACPCSVNEAGVYS